MLTNDQQRGVTPLTRQQAAPVNLAAGERRARLADRATETQQMTLALEQRVQERTRECIEAQEALLRRNRELSILNAVGAAVTQSLRLEELLGTALEEVLHLTDISVGAVFLMESATGSSELQVYRGTSEEAAQSMIRLHVGDGDCGGVLEKGQPVFIPDLRHYRAGAGALLRQAGLRSLVHIPLITRGMSLGTLCVASLARRDFPQEEMDLLMAIGNQIAVGVENARLYRELAHRDQLRGELLQKVIAGQEEERKRIARDLHDDTSQALTALIYSLEAAEGRCASGATRVALAAMRQLTTQTLEGVHKLILDLRPTVLDHLGLFVAMRGYAETRLQPLGIRLRFEEVGSTQRLPAQVETALFRVVQEATNNIARHSGARNVRLGLHISDNTLAICLEDDGIGFSMSELSRCNDQTRGLGLAGMEERVGLLGGTIHIDSEHGRGTRISVTVPIALPEAGIPSLGYSGSSS
jgi:signal transduction histidine kinase